jgi:hypothetical protein
MLGNACGVPWLFRLLSLLFSVDMTEPASVAVVVMFVFVFVFVVAVVEGRADWTDDWTLDRAGACRGTFAVSSLVDTWLSKVTVRRGFVVVVGLAWWWDSTSSE